MSLLETGKVTVETEQFNLRDAVQATMKMVSLGDAAIGKRFDTSMLDLPAEDVEGDRKKLTQVLLNLVRVDVFFFSAVVCCFYLIRAPHTDGEREQVYWRRRRDQGGRARDSAAPRRSH